MRFVRLLVLAVFAAGLLIPAAFASGNLIRDSGWDQITHDGAQARFESVSGGHGDSSSLKVTLLKAGGTAGWGHAPAAVEAGATYTYSEWFVTSGSSEIDVCYISPGDKYDCPMLDYIWKTDNPDEGAEEGSNWENVSYSITIPDGVVAVQVVHYVLLSKKPLRIDKVSLVRN